MRIIKLLFFLAFLTLIGCDRSEAVQEYLKNGQRLYEEGSYQKARIEFKNALQIDHQQAGAFYHLALMDEKDRNITDMYKNLEQTIQIDPENIEARLKLATLLLLSKDFDRVNEQVVEVLKRAENNSDALALKAAVLLKQKKMAASVQIVDAILARDAGNLSAIQLKVALYAEEKKYKEALGIIEKALANNNKDQFRLHQLKLQVLYALKDFPAVEKHYIVLIKKYPDTLEFSYRLADYYFQQKEGKKAVVLLEKTIKNNPDELLPKLALIKVLSRQDPKQAETKIKAYLAKAPKVAEFYFSLAKLYEAQKQPKKVIEQLQLLIKNTDDEEAQSNAKILLATNEKDPKVAEALVAEVLALNEHHLGGLLLKSKFKLSKGEYDDAIVSLRALLADYPKSDQAMVFLAEAYSKINSPELANDNFRKALEINPANEFAITAVVSTMIRDKNFMGAEEIIQAGLKRNPNNLNALLKLAEVQFLQQDWEAAEKVVARIAVQPNGLAASKYIEGRILQGQKLYADAIVKYKEALKLSPKLFSALESMMVSYEALKQRPVMHRYLADYAKAHPEQANVVSLQAQLYMLDKNWDKELALLTKANGKWPKIPALYQRISDIFLMKKEVEKAISTYKKGIEYLPDNIYLTMNLASIYENRQAYKESLALYEAFLHKKPKNNIAINNLASLLVDHFPTPENLNRALKLTKPFNDSKYLHLFDTYGWVLLANDRADEALRVFKNVVSKAPKVAVFRYHLAKAYAKTNNVIGAVSELEDALKIAEEGGAFADKEHAIALLKKLKP